jgi:transcriptional regulator with XRE-family HTH domain
MLERIPLAVQFSLWEYPGMENLSGAAFYERLMEALRDAQLDLTQTQIAGIAGVQQPAVSKWKSDESFPEYENALRLAQRACVSVSWLWLGLGNKKNGGDMDDQTIALLEAWHRMPEAARKELLEYIRFRAATSPDNQPTPPPVDSAHSLIASGIYFSFGS